MFQDEVLVVEVLPPDGLASCAIIVAVVSSLEGMGHSRLGGGTQQVRGWGTAG